MDSNGLTSIAVNYFRRYHKKTCYYFGIILLIIIILLLIYYIEKLIIYKFIYFILYIVIEKIFPIFFFKNINLFSITLEAIVITIYLHIILARLIILSVVFIQGGLFSKILSYEHFKFFMNLIINYSENAIENINKDNIEDVKFFMSKINLFRISYNKIKSKNISFIVHDFTFEEELNKMFQKYDDYLVNNNLETKNEFIDSIKYFSEKMNNYTNFLVFDQIFTFKCSESLMMMEEYMMNSFETHFVEKVNIEKDFDIYILSPKEVNNDNKILTIYCNQNALCCENYAIGHDNIDLYLYEINSTIILWNYTGFGLRKGLTTFAKVDKDINILSKYIKKNFNNYKIIIHGCSIGGYSSIKLMQKFNDTENVVLIADRTFADIDLIALSLSSYKIFTFTFKNITFSLSYGKILYFLYNILFPKLFYHSNNLDNYISIPSEKKLIFFDAKDEIIAYNPASLVFNITKKYYNDIVKPKIKKFKEYKSLIENIKNINLEVLELSSKNIDNDALIFIQHLNKYIDSTEEFFMFFIIFGFPYNFYKEIFCESDKFNNNYIEIPKTIMNFANKYKKNFSDKLLKLIQIFNFLFVKFNLKTGINDNDIIKLNYKDNDLFKFNDSFEKELHHYFGYVHRITCGHNGKLKSGDAKFIIKFLIKNKILPEYFLS